MDPTPEVVLRAFARLCDVVGHQQVAATINVHPSGVSRRKSGEQSVTLQELGELVREYRCGRPAHQRAAEELAHAVAQHMGGVQVLFGDESRASSSIREASNVGQILSIFDQAAALLQLVSHARPSGDLAAEELRIFLDRAEDMRLRLGGVTCVIRDELNAYDLHQVRRQRTHDG